VKARLDKEFPNHNNDTIKLPVTIYDDEKWENVLKTDDCTMVNTKNIIF
jgi:hypothetical protein